MNTPTTPNWTSFPNILFDYWMSKLKPAEFNILIALARQYCPLNKANTELSSSVNFLSKACGLTTTTIRTHLNNLCDLRLVSEHLTQEGKKIYRANINGIMEKK